MVWLEGMGRGEPSRAIRNGLIQQRQIDQGECECVPIGTQQQLQAALTQIADLQRQIAVSPSAAAAPTMDTKSLTKAIADGIAAGIKQAGLQVLSTNGNGHNEFASAPLPRYVCQMCDNEVEADGATCETCQRLKMSFLGLKFDENM